MLNQRNNISTNKLKSRTRSRAKKKSLPGRGLGKGWRRKVGNTGDVDGEITEPPEGGADGETGKEPPQELASTYEQHHDHGIWAPNPPNTETTVSSIHRLRPTIGIVGDYHDEDVDFRWEMFSISHLSNLY